MEATNLYIIKCYNTNSKVSFVQIIYEYLEVTMVNGDEFHSFRVY